MKKLLTQLFSSDAELLNLGDFADILIEENQVGTTVKVDDQKSDPYAILSIINLTHQKVSNTIFTQSTRQKINAIWCLGKRRRQAIMQLPF